MKKVIFVIAAGVMTLACSKEMKENQSALPVKKTGEYSVYEYFDSPTNTEDILSAFIDDVDADVTPGDKEIAEAIWLVEGALNYKYRHEYGVFENYETSTPISINIVRDGEYLGGASLVQAFNELDTEIQSNIGGLKLMHVVDLELDTLSEVVAVLKARMVYGTGLQSNISLIGYDATDDRRQAQPDYCNPGNPAAGNTGYDYVEKLTTSKFILNASYPSGSYVYAVNVTTFRSLSSIWEDLYAGQNDALYNTHVNLGDSWDCLSTWDLNHYRDVAYGNIQNLKSVNQEFVSLDISISGYSSIPGTYWTYNDVKLGEYNSTPQPPGY